MTAPALDFDTFEVAVVVLDTGEQQSLVRGAAGTVTASGHLVFAREASLWAVPFDADRLTVSGEPTPIVEGVQVNTGGWAHYAVADDGTLVYLPSVGVAGIDQRGLVWVDRVTGEETPLVVAPDGNGVVAMEVERAGGGDLIMVSLNGDPVTEDLLATAFDERGATLSPNGRWFAYQSDASGQMEVYISFPGCGR